MSRKLGAYQIVTKCEILSKEGRSGKPLVF